MYKIPKCKVCGNEECGQSFDHEKITENQFRNLFQGQARLNIFITDIKNKIKRTFGTLQKATLMALEKKETRVQTLVDQLKYWHLLRTLGSMKSIQAILFDFTLPKHRMIQLLKALQRKHKNSSVFPSFRTLQRQLQYVLSSQFCTQLNGMPYDYIFHRFSKIITEYEAKQLSDKCAPSIPRKPAEKQKGCAEYISIEEVPMISSKLNLNLSMLQVTDAMLLNYLPSISKMKCLQQLELQNNCLTEKGYQILFNALPEKTLITLNFRSSSLSNGIVKLLCQKMKRIQNLYLCDTGIGDDDLSQMCRSMRTLSIIKVDNNPITFEAASHFLTECWSLAYISLKNTKISKKEGKSLVKTAISLSKRIQV